MTRHPIRRALITGASRGLGLALARALTRSRATVVGIARDPHALEQALTPLGAIALAADVGTDEPEGLAARATSLAGAPFDLFVHAASTLGPLGDGEDPMPRLATVGDEDMRAVFAVNALGPAGLIRSLSRSMRREGGTVVVVSSDAAVEAYPGWGPYGASKAALDHLVRVWSAEETGLSFLSFDPGEMDTRMHADAMPGADRSELRDPDDVARALLRLIHEGFESGARKAVA